MVFILAWPGGWTFGMGGHTVYGKVGVLGLVDTLYIVR